jgi:hypothetical protein
MDSCSRSESKQASSSSSFTCKVNNVRACSFQKLCHVICKTSTFWLSETSFCVQVYEEKSMGILCYTDEKGELVCEGLDEGPRLTWQDMQNLTKER